MWDFQGSLLLVLEFPRYLSNTILWNTEGLSFVLSGVSRGKVKKWKIPGGVSKKYILNPPCLNFFWNSPFLKMLWLHSYIYLKKFLNLKLLIGCLVNRLTKVNAKCFLIFTIFQGQHCQYIFKNFVIT